MKNILLTLALAASTLACSAQKLHQRTAHQSDSVGLGQTSVSWYASASLSMSSGDRLALVSYPSVEVGRTCGITTLALNFGRRNLAKPEGEETSQNYYYEPKIAVSVPLGRLQTYLLFGAGGYFNTEHYLIEYGTGITWPLGAKHSLSVQVSNFDATDYVSVGVSQAF